MAAFILTFGIAIMILFAIIAVRRHSEKRRGCVRHVLGIGIYQDGTVRAAGGKQVLGYLAGSRASVIAQGSHGMLGRKHDATTVITYADGTTSTKLHKDVSTARLAREVDDFNNAAVKAG
jgi:hypothetical protein